MPARSPNTGRSSSSCYRSYVPAVESETRLACTGLIGPNRIPVIPLGISLNAMALKFASGTKCFPSNCPIFYGPIALFAHLVLENITCLRSERFANLRTLTNKRTQFCWL